MALGTEIYGLGFRFSPTPQEAVTYYLPRLVSGHPLALPEVVSRVVHRADVYACEPADLARRFRPMPSTHNRFFFTFIRKGVRAAGPGSWAGQSTVPVEIKDKQGRKVKIGELKKFRYKKRGDLTDWLMEEYSPCGLDSGAAAGGMQPVMCKVYVSPKAAPNSAAYQESAACFAPPPPPPAAPTFIVAQPAAKRPAPPPPAAPTFIIAQPAAKRPAPPHLPPPAAPTVITPPAAKRPAPPQGAAMPPYPKRARATVVHSALPPPPPAPARTHVAAVQKLSFAPPQPFAPRRGSTAPSATQPSPAPSPPLVMPPVPARHAVQLHRSPLPLPTSPRPLAQPKVPPWPTPPVASASHMPQQAPAPPHCPPPQVLVQPKQRRIIVDPFEAAMLREEAEQQTLAPAAAAPYPTAAMPALQDQDEDGWDDLDRELGIEDATPALQDEDEDEDEWDDLAQALDAVVTE